MKRNLIFAMMIAIGVTCFAANPESDFEYELFSDGSGIMITGYKGRSKTIDIPETIEGLPVIQLGKEYSQSFLYGLKDNGISYTVSVPKTVKVLELNAFMDFKGKISIDITQLEEICNFAFTNSNLTGTVVIKPDMEIGYMAFKGSKISEVIVQEEVTELSPGEYFSNCQNLKSVTLPKTLETMGPMMFRNCQNLTEIIIPEGIKIRYEEAFSGEGQFQGCSSLSSETKAKIRATGYLFKF